MFSMSSAVWSADEEPQVFSPSLRTPASTGEILDPFESRAEALRRAKREQEKAQKLTDEKKALSPNDDDSLLKVQAQTVVDFWAKSAGGVPVVEHSDGTLGEPNTSAVLGYADVHSTIDTAENKWWDNGQFYARLLFTFGTSPSVFAGDVQGVSNVDARGYEVGKLMELWYQHEYPYSHANVRVGMQDVKDRFYQMEYTGLFVNKSLQLDGVFTHAGLMPTYPNASLGLTFHTNLTPGLYWSGGLYDGTPGATDEYFNTSVNSSEGVLSMIEAGYASGERYTEAGYWRIAAGGWYLKKEIHEMTGLPTVNEKHINQAGSYRFDTWWVNRPGVGGGYAMLEGQLIDNLGGFAKFAMGDQFVNRLYQFWTVGLHVRGLLPGRNLDEFGLALIQTRQSPYFLANNPLMYLWDGDNVVSAKALSAETIVEVTYQAKVRHWLKIQPNMQFIQNPGMSAFNAASTVMGVRMIADY